MFNRYSGFSDRELTIKEVKELKRELNAIAVKKAFQVKFLMGWAAIAVAVGILSFFYTQPGHDHYYLLSGCVLIYILIGYWGYFEQSRALNKKRSGLNFVITENKAKFIRVVSENYIELSEDEDEGVDYLFQLSDDRILSFGG